MKNMIEYVDKSLTDLIKKANKSSFWSRLYKLKVSSNVTSINPNIITAKIAIDRILCSSAADVAVDVAVGAVT